MTRTLHERDTARTSADKLVRAVLDRLVAAPDDDLAAALVGYYNSDGPAWALPSGEFLITRYDWTVARTVVVSVFADKASADVELERLQKVERIDRASGKIVMSNHYAVMKRA